MPGNLTARDVRELNYWRQGLDEIPPEVFKHTKLEVLNLSENRLTSISLEIGNLRNLRTLDLGHNQLSQLPESMAQLETLSDLARSVLKVYMVARRTSFPHVSSQFEVRLNQD